MNNVYKQAQQELIKQVLGLQSGITNTVQNGLKSVLKQPLLTTSPQDMVKQGVPVLADKASKLPLIKDFIAGMSEPPGQGETNLSIKSNEELARSLGSFVGNAPGTGAVDDAVLKGLPLIAGATKGLDEVTDISKIAKNVELPKFEGLQDLTTQVIEKLRGSRAVSPQTISNLSNQPGVKEAEKNVLRKVLEKYKGSGEVNNMRNDFGVKNADDIYRNTGGKNYTQWTDDTGDTKELAEKALLREQKDNPSDNFILRKQGDIYRILKENKPAASAQPKIPVQQFAEDVKGELLPLENWRSDRDFGTSDYSRVGQYENVTLPNELRGNVSNYHENIYQSPIKTSAGNVHYSSDDAPGYFAHTRVEDLSPDGSRESLTGLMGGMSNEYADVLANEAKRGSTRRVIEIQSDLFQKGRLDKELTSKGSVGDIEKIAQERGIPFQQAAQEIDKVREGDVGKLKPYENTWHERVIREEVKKAAQDGKTKLQFPTGETAMKIEGLGDNTKWFLTDSANGDVPIGDLTPDNLKVGQSVATGDAQDWVVTDVLGDGKFKAVPKELFEQFNPEKLPNGKWVTQARGMQKELHDSQPDPFDYFNRGRNIEQFDISGKVDQNNPIYKFYESEVSKYLKKKYNAQRITDPQGVEWWELNVNPNQGKAPIEAFGLGALGLGGQKKEEDEKMPLQNAINSL